MSNTIKVEHRTIDENFNPKPDVEVPRSGQQFGQSQLVGFIRNILDRIEGVRIEARRQFQVVPGTENQILDAAMYSSFGNAPGDAIETWASWTLTDGAAGDLVTIHAEVSSSGLLGIKGKVSGGSLIDLVIIGATGSGFAGVTLLWITDGWRVLSVDAFRGALGSSKPDISVYGILD